MLILDVNGGTVLKTNAKVYHFKRGHEHPIARPMVEAWDKAWKAGVERTVIMTLLPIGRGERVRVRARATFIAPGNPSRLQISPGRIDSRALDDTEFPTVTTYLWVSRDASLRRSVRRIERRLRDLDESQQRRFAEALGTALENPSTFSDFGNLGPDAATRQTSQSLLGIVPGMAELLKRDPLQALENLTCLVKSLNCHSALIYFRVPQPLWAELSAEEVARLEAKRVLEKEKGGIELVALLDAEGITYTRDKSGGIVVRVGRDPVQFGTGAGIVAAVLDRVIALLGPAADKVRLEANGLSFARLRAQIGATAGAGVKP